MKWLVFVIIAVVNMAPVSASGTSERSDTSNDSYEIIVGAAASLSDALEETLASWKLANPRARVTVTYGSSGAIQKHVEQGAPIDVFISASPKQVDALERKGLVAPGTRRVLLENELVLVVPAREDGRRGVTGWKDLAGSGVSRVALGEPSSVPAGAYAEETLSALGILDAVRAKAVYAKDVREALAFTSSGDVEAGIVYATDATDATDATRSARSARSARVRVVAAAPSGSHSPIEYPVCAIASSGNLERAKRLIDWLLGVDASRTFARYGFVIPSR